MRILIASVALAMLLPVALVLFLSGLVCLALRALHIPFDWLYGRCREFFLYVESGVWHA
jgi:hypothetical protein